MATVVNELGWQTLTAAVNAMANSNQFLTRLLYPNEQELYTEKVDLSVITDTREIAPFVRKNGEALLVQGTGKNFSSVEAPNIRIKMPFTPSQLLFSREPGTGVHLLPGQSQQASVQQHIARDLQSMERKIQNAQEYLVALSLQGSIAYSVADQEVFTITIPRAGANNITMTTFLNDGTPANVRILAMIQSVKAIMADIPGSEGLSVTDAICGSEAAAAIYELVESGNIKMLGLEGQNVSVGNFSFTEQFKDTGVIYMGMLGGVRFWKYARTANLNGVAVNMIRPKYIEFVSVGPASERVMYYGAIADMTAFQSGVIAAKRFSKSWLLEDPSVLMALDTSRPLPWPRKPNATVSVKAVSG